MEPYVTIRSRGNEHTGPSVANQTRSATHDISRTSFHVKHISQFAQRVEESAGRAFPNRGRSSQRYSKVQSLLLHWGTDDLFVLPELEDLERCFRDDYAFGTDIWAIPSENSHLELMMRLGQLIKDHESPDTLFIVYYGGHARIDESRQSTWCATRDPDSPWLQWSAIQTLLERSRSDVLILLDCCAGAASATFPTGDSITETISASSWDAIAPDPGRYSFTNALIEVMQQWRHRDFSAAMLHAEVLARLKHPRPITINGKYFEARSTPVHFMMTANHRAPSIELTRVTPHTKQRALPSSVIPHMGHAFPLMARSPADPRAGEGRGGEVEQQQQQQQQEEEPVCSDPNEDTPHVMISVALEEDQSLDINAWEQWLNAFPAMAKYVKIQGVFKSHSTLMLVSMPVNIWDLLPEDQATTFVAFIRSNNLASQKPAQPPTTISAAELQGQPEITSNEAEFSVADMTRQGTTSSNNHQSPAPGKYSSAVSSYRGTPTPTSSQGPSAPSEGGPREYPSVSSLNTVQRQASSASLALDSAAVPQQRPIMNQQQLHRRTTFGDDVPEPKKFAPHVERRLEEYYLSEPLPNDAQKAFFASNLGVEPWHLEVWFHHRRERDALTSRLAAMTSAQEEKQLDTRPDKTVRMILPHDLDQLLNISAPEQVILFDLRSQVEFSRSHVFGAVNLRVPRSFLEVATLEMISRAIPDSKGEEIFSKWRRARCIVFYGKGLEYPWECPPARYLLERLQQQGWEGRAFILKGHYREFSDSFDKYIAGSKMTAAGRAWVEEQELARSHFVETRESKGEEHFYPEWLAHVEKEDEGRGQIASPKAMSERAQVLENLDKELEVEFRASHGELFRKALEVNHPEVSAQQQQQSSIGVDRSDMKAQLVESMDRGLSKMRGEEQQVPQSPPAPAYETGPSKLAGEDSRVQQQQQQQERDVAEEYVQVRGTRGRVQAQMGASGDETGKGRSNILQKVFRRS